MSQKLFCVYTLTGLLLWVLPCAAQLTIGDELQLQGSGTLSAGYAGQFSDESTSAHSLNFGVNGNLSGSAPIVRPWLQDTNAGAGVVAAT